MEKDIQTIDNNFSDKYQIKSEIEHILDRSGMYLGSTSTDLIEYPLFVPSKNKIQLLPNIGYNAGLLKIVDELISNSVDEHRRKDSLFHITKIKVTINTNGYICIEDNGGIPVQIHKQLQIPIPQLIFGTLRTSSNYDDTQDREVIGTNGLGAKLTNIMSLNFAVQTYDGKNSISITWSNNMREIVVSDIIPTSEHKTKIAANIDLSRFELEAISLHTIRILQKRCIEAAAVNPGLEIEFVSDAVEGKLDSIWKFNSFKEYVLLFLDEHQSKNIIEYNYKRDNIIIIPENIGFNLGFVNGAACSDGTHIKKIQNQLVEKLLDICKSSDMELITEKDILNRISICLNTIIINPTYDSQTKTKLTNKIDKFALLLNKDFLDSLKNSAIFQSLVDYYEIKYAEQKKKELKKLNDAIRNTKSRKLITCASKNPDINELWLFEGNSASNGFQHNRNLYQSAYLLRGKIKNTFNLDRNQILLNVELREVIATLGLLFNEPKNNVKNCKFKKIIIASDADYDGDHICGLLLAFFAKHFPELFRAGYIYRALSPIVVCNKKGEEPKYFYSYESFDKAEPNFKGWKIIHCKGLGSLQDIDYREMLRNQRLIKFSLNTNEDLEAVQIWFDKATEMRKSLIMFDENIDESELIENNN